MAVPSYAADPTKIQKKLEPYYHTYRPDGAGPFPAIMMVSGCSGFMPSVAPTGYTRRAEELRGEGFLVIFVDYLAARRLERCAEGGRYVVDTEDVGFDILASAAYLRGLPEVKTSDITAMGWSYGGGGVLEALRATRPAEPLPFRGAVLLYPYCKWIRPWKVAVPVLFLMGALDDVAPPSVCQGLIKKVEARDSVEVHVYPEARHGFDAPELSTVTSHPGGTMGYNEAAATAAWAEIRKFLRR